jgi:uncharacterized protein (TIGR03435 family)
MGEWLSSAEPAVGNHLWQSTAFAAVVWVVTLALRKNQARVRYGLWVAASMKFMVPFSLLIGLGGMLPRPRHAVITMPVYSAVDEVGLPFSGDELPTTVATTVHVSEARHGAPTLSAVLEVVWICGVVVVLVVWCERWRQVARTLRRAVRVEDGREAALLRQAEEAIGGRIPLMLSNELMEPGMFGIVRPVLIWPERLSERLEDEHIEAILTHELMHARRRDNLTAALRMIVEAVFWFHPMVWWMERRMVEERERACDEAVVEMGRRPGIYAESLLKAVRFCVESQLVCVAGITGADLSKRVRSIMTQRLERLGVMRKITLAVLGFLAIAGPVAFGVVRMIPVYGQVLHATGALPAFDVVAIKPSQEPPQGGTTTGEQVRLVVTAKLLIQLAYNVPMLSDEQVAGGPEWINTDVFDILAKMDSAKFTAMQNLNRAQKREQQQLMEESLLADRFKLKMHFETRDLPVYALTATKNFKLKPVTVAPGGATMTPNPQADGPRPQDLRRGLIVQPKGRGFEMTAKGVTMDGLVHALIPRPELGGRTVVDQTGLKDAYDFTLDWGPDQTAAPESGDVEEPPLFTAIQQQLGLKLAAAKGPGEVIVIDHIEKPAFDEAVVAPAPAALVMNVALVQPNPAQSETKAPSVTTPAKLPSFEVATIKPVASMHFMPSSSGGVAPNGEQIISQQSFRSTPSQGSGGQFSDIVRIMVPTRMLIGFAYNLPLQSKAQIVGGPDWIDQTTYQVQAKIDDSLYASMQKMTAQQQKEQVSLMEQSLLADRFRLKAHFETRELPVYALVVAKGGPKLTPTKDEPAPPSTATAAQQTPAKHNGFTAVGKGNAYEIIATGLLLHDLAPFLQQQPEVDKRVVVDQTGLSGVYDFKMNWTRQVSAGADAGLSTADAGPYFFTALKEQLGLELVQTKGPARVLVIDSIERPSEN